jgi:glycosyltransferase involved in cell wall biosynthesis
MFPMSQDLELTIVMPCLNEAETLGTCIQKARQAIANHGLQAEIVVGDNGSTDGSQAIAQELGARVIPVPLRGYGAALYHASKSARGRYIVMADSDDSYDFLGIMPFVEKLREGYDLVVGNRFKGGVAKGAMPWKNRYIGNPILSGIGKLIFRSKVNDFHCGMRAFSKKAFESMDLRTTGMEFASEMVIKATLTKLKVTEVPTTLSPDGRSRPPHLRPWRDGWRHLRFILLYSPRWLFFYPGVAMTFIGASVTFLLHRGPLMVGAFRLDVHSMLFTSCLALLGVQAISLAIFARILATDFKLLPTHPTLDRVVSKLKVEFGMLTGVSLFLAGALGFARAVSFWRDQSFGDLEGTATLRLSIMSVFLLALGAQMTFNSFFLGLLNLRYRELD